MAVIDGTQESEAAIRYAVRRAEMTKIELIILAVIDNPGFTNRLGVDEKINQGAEDEALQELDKFRNKIKSFSSVECRIDVKHGTKLEVVKKTITGNNEISYLFLTANKIGQSPGELAEAIASSGYSIPVVIIPRDIGFDKIDKLAGKDA